MAPAMLIKRASHPMSSGALMMRLMEFRRFVGYVKGALSKVQLDGPVQPAPGWAPTSDW